MAHSSINSSSEQPTVWRPIITIWGMSLCFLVGLIVGVPQTSQPEAEHIGMTGTLAGSQRIAALPGFGPAYGNSSLAVERFDRAMAATSAATNAAKDEACQQRAENLTDAREKQQQRIERIRARTTDVQSEAYERVEAVLASTRS